MTESKDFSKFCLINCPEWILVLCWHGPVIVTEFVWSRRFSLSEKTITLELVAIAT